MTHTAIIDGKDIEFQAGETILHGARRLGIDIPTLCYSEKLKPEGGCRMCLVEVEGRARPMAACATPLMPGMRVETKTDLVENLRRDILSLYFMTEDPVSLCESDSEFRRLVQHYGVGAPIGEDEVDESHPYLRIRKDLCINCRRCVNACEQVQGQFVYSMAMRGPVTHLIFGANGSFAESGCVACGACVDECPTGAISDRDRIHAHSAERTTESVCGYCGVGCRVEVSAIGDDVLSIRGVPDAAVNRGHLCVKGRYAHAWHSSPDRLKKPLKRVGEDFIEIEWDAAYALAAEKLSAIRDKHGPEALGVFTSSRSTNEACYLLQKLFRTQLHSNNVDCCARVCHSSTALALQRVTGTGAASASYADIEQAKVIFLAGANPTEAHPVTGARIKQAVLNGAPLIVADPRRIELAEYATVHLGLRPGTNVALFNAIAKVLIDEGLIDGQYLAERCEGFGELRAMLEETTLDELSAQCAVSIEKIQHAARLMGGPVLFVHGLGLSELVQGTASVMTLCNLGMLTGSIGRVGGGMLPLRGQNNVQGAADMGSMPNQVTGYQSITDPVVRERFENAWGCALPPNPGLTIPEMLDASAAGDVKALWLMGEDIVQSDPHQKHVIEALENLDFLIVQEMFFSETCRYADLIFPAAGCLEQEGTFTNGERRIQHVRPAVAPPRGAKPDWVIVRDIANALGAHWNIESPAEIMDEIAKVAPHLFGGVSFSRLEGDGLQWPCPKPGHPGTAAVHADKFIRGKGLLSAIPQTANPEHDVDGFPLLLITGRILDHYNVGTMTRRTPQSDIAREDYIVMHPHDADEAGLKNGDAAEIESRWGSTVLTARISHTVEPGQLFASFHYPESKTNQLTGPYVDPESKCPQYKVIAVRIKAAAGVGAS